MKTMINFTYFDDENVLQDITGLDHEELWKFLCLDDWDYGIITKTTLKSPPLKKDCTWLETRTITPQAAELDRLLSGCSSNTWYFVKGKNANYIVGMAYHA